MMKSYPSMTRAELLEELERVRALYDAEKEKGYDLDMSRGKPAPIQLDLSMGLLEEEPSSLVRSRCGTDVRNYGALA
ncbi:MAG: aminotransferase, partial [Clostridia bacterium]|nr:aminotransferase [Clostridia bacterium]